jgi:hypothetical protein
MVAPLAPEASSSTVSLVEVSPSTEMRLKLSSMALASTPAARRAQWRVGEDVDQHGGVGNELGVDHARALADAGDAHFALRSLVASPSFEAGEGGFLHGVGGENGLRHLLEVVELWAE